MNTKYTVVQHSGFGYGAKPDFAKAVEVRTLTKKGEIDLVTRVGGMLFDSWREADEFCDDTMYPPDVQGLIPQVRGTFSERKVDGLAIYIPERKGNHASN